MLTNNLLPKFSFLLPKKENWPMYLVQIVTLIFMIAVFGSHGFTDSDTSFLIAEPIRENQKLSNWWGIGWPLIFKGLYLINHNLITFNSLFKIQTVFYVFFLGKICLIIFKNKNIKLSVFLFLITFYSPFLFLFEISFTKDTLYLSLFTSVFFVFLLSIKSKKSIYYIIFFIISILFTLTRQNAYILIMPLLVYASWIFVANNPKTLLSYKKRLGRTILLLFLHILLGFSLLFILDFTLRITKSYSSSTLINNDILTIVTLGGSIRDKDINYYAHKYIDKIGGINGKSEAIYYGTKSIKDFDSLNIEQQEEIIFVRYLISGFDSHLLKKEEFKSRITSYEENRNYIKKVWLYAVIDNPIIYLQHKILYMKFVFKNIYKLRSNWLFNNSKPVRDFLIHTYSLLNYSLLVLTSICFITSSLYFKFIRKSDSINIIILISLFINIITLSLVIPVPIHRYFLADIFLMTLLSARNSISLIYYACTKNKI
jgi:hypothetical protein